MTQLQHAGLSDLFLVSRTPFCIVDEKGRELSVFPKEFSQLYLSSVYLTLIKALKQSAYADGVLEYYLDAFWYVAITALHNGNYLITAPVPTAAAKMDGPACLKFIREEKLNHFMKFLKDMPPKRNFPLFRLASLGRYLYSGVGCQGEVAVKHFHAEEAVLLRHISETGGVKPAMADALFNSAETPLNMAPHHRTTAEAIQYVRTHIYQRISIQAISEHVHLNRSTLSAYFKQDTGMTITAFINEVKLGEAKRLLEDPNIGYPQIIDLLGFCNQSYFIKKFRERFGITPQQYRKRCLAF